MVSSTEPNVVLIDRYQAMIAVWIASEPFHMLSGIKIYFPESILFSALLLSSFTSLATGTSWGTLGTVGLALIGIGSHGHSVSMTASAIICSAYFGDKMSPLSDSTILAASVTRTHVPHVKHMFYGLQLQHTP